MIFLLPLLFAGNSRIFDFAFASLHVPGILFALVAILVSASTQVGKVLSDRRIGRYMALFTVWTFATVPFSAWRGGALHDATQIWPRALLTFLALSCLPASLPSIRRAIYTWGFAVFVLAVLAKKYGDFSMGRLALPQGEFENPNDLGMALLMGFPYLIFVAMEAGICLRLAALGGLIPVFWALLQTGSRGALLALGVVTAFLFLRCSPAGRILVVAGFAAVLAAAVVVLPHRTIVRYTILFKAGTDAEQLQADDPNEMRDVKGEEATVASSNARYDLLIASLKMTLQHPIVGVGIGQFMAARHVGSENLPYKISWQPTHNTYTQISSETGLVGFFFYMAAFVGCFRLGRQLERFAKAQIHPQWRTISRMAFCLRTSLVSFAVTSFFASVGYSGMFQTIAGLMLALAYACEPYFSQWQEQQKQFKATVSGPMLRPGEAAAPVRLPARRFA